MRPTSSPAGSRPSRRGSCRTCSACRSLLITAEASYHAAYDHCIVRFLNQAGVTPTWIKLADARHPRQQPQHDAGEELRRDRRGDLSVAGEDAAGTAVSDRRRLKENLRGAPRRSSHSRQFRDLTRGVAPQNGLGEHVLELPIADRRSVADGRGRVLEAAAGDEIELAGREGTQIFRLEFLKSWTW